MRAVLRAFRAHSGDLVPASITLSPAPQSPAGMGAQIVPIFPEPAPNLPSSEEALEEINARYVADAYNSLSIEGYHVTADLIERVASGN